MKNHSLVFAALLTLFLLAGCGASEPTTTDLETAEPTAVVISEADTAEAAGSEQDTAIEVAEPTAPAATESTVVEQPDTSPAVPSDSGEGTELTATEAEEIALQDAGISRSEVKYINSHLEYHDHQPYSYEVKFGLTNGTDYQYEISLSTGEILDQHREHH